MKYIKKYCIKKNKKGIPIDNLKYKKFRVVIEEKNSEKIMIIKPKKNTMILENLCFRFSLGKNNTGKPIH